MGKKSIHDVAKRAGVSIKTVSRVINNEPNVRDNTRDVVQKAIQELNYRPNASARSLKGKRSYIVALLYDNPSPSYVGEVQQGVIHETRERGYDLLIHPCNYHDKNLVNEIDSLVRHTRADGIILTPPISDHRGVIAALKDMNVAFVRIAPGATNADFNAVTTNDRTAVADLTRYLVSLGHNKIAFILGHEDHLAVANRYMGFEDGLASCDISLVPDYVMQGDNTFKSGEECARKLLLQKDRPTAIIASNDDMAMGVLRVAHEMRIKIPDELSVAGFDDIPHASRVWPSLTTIRQPVRKMGERATQILLGSLSKEDSGFDQEEIPSNLVLRESSGPKLS